VLVKLLAAACILQEEEEPGLQAQQAVLVVVARAELAAHQEMLGLQTAAVAVVVDKVGMVEMVVLDVSLFLFQPEITREQQLAPQLLLLMGQIQ